MKTSLKIRPSRFAGSFYSGDSHELRNELESRLASSPVIEGGVKVVSAAVPHAGYVFSADIAAPVFKALQGADFDTVVIIGHDFGDHAPGIIAVLPDYDAFRTPLGDVMVDREMCEALLAADKRIVMNNRVHDMEHTVEVQLPWLKIIRPEAKIVPAMFGEVTPEHCRRFAELIAETAGERKVLVLSSTDMSHYPTKESSRQLDKKTVSYAESFDIEGLCSWRSHGEWERHSGVVTPICSAGGLATAMLWAQMHGKAVAKVMKRGNSGDASGDDDRTVGYASMVFVVAEDDKKEFSVSKEIQRHLLNLARTTILHGTECRRVEIPISTDAELQQPAAVFVTLHKNGRLRGCIGTTQASMPLERAVVEYALAAAFQDPRFPEVTADELKDIVIEISILSPMRRVKSAEEIIPGKHGVVAKQGRRCGLFLPQVWEQLPDKEQFLGYLCAEKAGLPYNAWQSPETELSVFTVVAFEES
ncbi:MAG: AmmeMemoRadiSam system protein B [Victivallales bacterium]|nr:AmmeMemoRadiSam system protein B [Victivallales bacterium]